MHIDIYVLAGGGVGNCLQFILKLCRVLFQIESPSLLLSFLHIYVMLTIHLYIDSYTKTNKSMCSSLGDVCCVIQ